MRKLSEFIVVAAPEIGFALTFIILGLIVWAEV